MLRHERHEMNQPEDIPSSEYATSDLGQAAFLLAREIPLLRVEREGERARFVFPVSASETSKLFYQPGRNMVDARRFHMNLRELRGLARGEGRR
jgi:hypothetical protein